MGAWGHHFDENDSALDWIAEFEEAPSWSLIQDIFETVFAEEDVYDVDSDDCSAAIVAGEIVAAALGRASDRLSAPLLAWAQANADGAEALKADAAKAALLIRDDSELSELWIEADDADQWKAAVDDLISRLS